MRVTGANIPTMLGAVSASWVPHTTYLLYERPRPARTLRKLTWLEALPYSLQIRRQLHPETPLFSPRNFLHIRGPTDAQTHPVTGQEGAAWHLACPSAGRGGARPAQPVRLYLDVTPIASPLAWNFKVVYFFLLHLDSSHISCGVLEQNRHNLQSFSPD